MVTRSIPVGSIAVGNPVRVVGRRGVTRPNGGSGSGSPSGPLPHAGDIWLARLRSGFKNLIVAEAGSMTVRDRVFSAFKESFDLDDDIDTSKLVYQDFPAWTSVGHMILVAALESEFDTMLETDDILEMSNFEKAVSIMGKYANVA
jgi:acyl carrier protein